MAQFSVGISEFRAQMSHYLKQVENGAVITLMNRDKEVARLVPPNFAQTLAWQELAQLRETAVVGDVLTPIEQAWSANKPTAAE